MVDSTDAKWVESMIADISSNRCSCGRCRSKVSTVIPRRTPHGIVVSAPPNSLTRRNPDKPKPKPMVDIIKTKPATGEALRPCGVCHVAKPKTDYSNKQWDCENSIARPRRCQLCALLADYSPLQLMKTITHSYYYDTKTYEKSDTQCQTLVLSVNEDGGDFCLGRKKNGLEVPPGPYCKIQKCSARYSDSDTQIVPVDWILEYKIGENIPATEKKTTTRSYSCCKAFKKSKTQSEAVVLDVNVYGWGLRKFSQGRERYGLPVPPGPYCKVCFVSDKAIQTVPVDWITVTNIHGEDFNHLPRVSGEDFVKEVPRLKRCQISTLHNNNIVTLYDLEAAALNESSMASQDYKKKGSLLELASGLKNIRTRLSEVLKALATRSRTSRELYPRTQDAKAGYAWKKINRAARKIEVGNAQDPKEVTFVSD